GRRRRGSGLPGDRTRHDLPVLRGPALSLRVAYRDGMTSAALDVLREFPVLDGHNDLPWALRQGAPDPLEIDISRPVDFTHTDLRRLRAGGVGAQFWSVYVPAELADQSAVATTLEQIDLVHRLIARHQDELELARTGADVERIMAAGKIASLIGAEGG